MMLKLPKTPSCQINFNYLFSAEKDNRDGGHCASPAFSASRQGANYPHCRRNNYLIDIVNTSRFPNSNRGSIINWYLDSLSNNVTYLVEYEVCGFSSLRPD